MNQRIWWAALLAVVLGGCPDGPATEGGDSGDSGDTATSAGEQYEGDVRIDEFDYQCDPGLTGENGENGVWWFELSTNGVAPQATVTMDAANLEGYPDDSGVETTIMPYTDSDPLGWWGENELELNVNTAQTSLGSTVFPCNGDTVDGMIYVFEVFDATGVRLDCKVFSSNSEPIAGYEGCDPPTRRSARPGTRTTTASRSPNIRNPLNAPAKAQFDGGVLTARESCWGTGRWWVFERNAGVRRLLHSSERREIEVPTELPSCGHGAIETELQCDPLIGPTRFHRWQFCSEDSP